MPFWTSFEKHHETKAGLETWRAICRDMDTSKIKDWKHKAKALPLSQSLNLPRIPGVEYNLHMIPNRVFEKSTSVHGEFKIPNRSKMQNFWLKWERVGCLPSGGVIYKSSFWARDQTPGTMNVAAKTPIGIRLDITSPLPGRWGEYAKPTHVTETQNPFKRVIGYIYDHDTQDLQCASEVHDSHLKPHSSMKDWDTSTCHNNHQIHTRSFQIPDEWKGLSEENDLCGLVPLGDGVGSTVRLKASSDGNNIQCVRDATNDSILKVSVQTNQECDYQKETFAIQNQFSHPITWVITALAIYIVIRVWNFVYQNGM